MKNQQNDNLNSLEQIFSALTNLFSFPDKEYFLNQIFIENNVDAFNQFNPETGLIFNNLKQIIIDNPNENLMVEYARLFVGPYKLIAPPYGSFYLDKGRLMGDSTMEVIKIFEMAGLSINSSFKDLPDHIIAELEFLYYLFYNKNKMIEKNELVQAELLETLISSFYQKFFFSWIPTFTNLIIENTSSNFYKNLGKLINLVCNDINKKIIKDFKNN